MVCDDHNWAIGHFMHEVSNLLEKYNVIVVDEAEFKDGKDVLLERADCYVIGYSEMASLLKPQKRKNAAIGIYQSFEFDENYEAYVNHHDFENMVPRQELDDLKDYKSIITTTEKFGRPLRRLFDTVEIVRNPINQDIFTYQQKSKQGKLTFAWAGNPDHNDYKNYDYFERLRQLPAQFKSATGQITSRDRMAQFYHNTDFLVVTSYSEGEPLTAVEASSTGTPIVGYDVGIMDHLATDIVEFGFEPLRNKIKSLIQSPDLAARSKKARDNFERYCGADNEYCRSTWKSLIESL